MKRATLHKSLPFSSLSIGIIFSIHCAGNEKIRKKQSKDKHKTRQDDMGKIFVFRLCGVVDDVVGFLLTTPGLISPSFPGLRYGSLSSDK
jgi:hypothetical protein